MKVDDYVDAIKADGTPDPELYNYISRQSRGALTQALSSSLIIYENAFLTKVERLRMVQLAAILVIGITLMLEAFAIFMPLVGRVSKYAERLHEISMTDMLTGIGNRRYFVRRARQEVKRAARLEKGLCICMVDIDFFKTVNDTHGHAAGDYVLREFVEIIKSAIRLEDDVARIGGEEFIILLPASDLESSLIVAERVRQRLEERPFVLPETGQTLKVTASFGLTQVYTEKDEDIEIAMARADDALYASKENGRNRVNYARFTDGEIIEADVTVQVTHKPTEQDKAQDGRHYDSKVTPLKPV
jgi:diguanylate cyclase (GGDEF)-like protein